MGAFTVWAFGYHGLARPDPIRHTYVVVCFSLTHRSNFPYTPSLKKRLLAITLLHFENRDLLMLSTRGLHSELSTEGVARHLISKSDIETEIESLINEAPKSGKGKITVYPNS